MRLSLFRRSIPSSGTPYQATAVRATEVAVDLATELLEARAERDAAVKARDEIAEGIRQALISAGYFHCVDVVLGVRRMAAEFVETVAELRALKLNPAATGDQARRQEVAELRRLLEASPEQAHRNCLDLSDRNAELRRAISDLEKRVAEFEGRAAKRDPEPAPGPQMRSPWAPC